MRAGHELAGIALGLCLLASACGDEATPAGADAAANPGTDLGLSQDAAVRADAGTPVLDLGGTGPVDAAPTADSGVDAGEDADGGAWSPLSPLPGGPRQETSVVELGGEIYVLGGFNASAQVVSTVEAYDPANDTWRARASLPFAMHHINAGVVNGKIYVVGALTGLGFVQNPNVLSYDPSEDRWDPLGQMPADTDRGASGVAVIGTKLYLAGGYRAGQALRMFSAYDTETGQFEPLPELPSPLDHLVSVAVGGRVYVIGGRNGGIAATTAEVWGFDPAVPAWQARASLPRPRAGFAGAAALSGRIYVFGGEGNPEAGSRGVFADVDAYDPAEDRWLSLTAMRTPRHGTAAAALGDGIFVPGGATQQAFGAVDVHEVFRP